MQAKRAARLKEAAVWELDLKILSGSPGLRKHMALKRRSLPGALKVMSGVTNVVHDIESVKALGSDDQPPLQLEGLHHF